MEKTRIALYIGIVYHLICSLVVGTFVGKTNDFGDFGKYVLALGIIVGMWHSILLWLRCMDEKD